VGCSTELPANLKVSRNLNCTKGRVPSSGIGGQAMIV
jgi:hypothetical protein